MFMQKQVILNFGITELLLLLLTLSALLAGGRLVFARNNYYKVK